MSNLLENSSGDPVEKTYVYTNFISQSLKLKNHVIPKHFFEKASGLFGNTTARSQREVSDMSTMIPDEVYGLGLLLLFGFHRKSVSSLRLNDLLCMSTFWKSAKKSQILSHEIHIQTSVFYDGFAAPGVFQHQRPFDTLWNTRTITGLLEKSTLVAK